MPLYIILWLFMFRPDSSLFQNHPLFSQQVFQSTLVSVPLAESCTSFGNNKAYRKREAAFRMGVLENIRGRDTSLTNAAANRSDPVDEKSPDQSQNAFASDSDTLSLEARNEKEIQAHPDQITADAEIGVQKAEATALVWSKKTVYAVYAW